MGSAFKVARVECYAGYKGDETPRAVVLDGRRFEVASVLSRKRILVRDGGRMRDVWRCRLEDGRAVTVERHESGTWRLSSTI
jgi:hypothetical protein